MNILFDENIPYGLEAFSSLGNVTSLAGRGISPADLENTDILFVRSVTKVNESLLKNTNVKFVATATSGSDHIDKDFLQKNNIGFSDAIGSNANSVAEYFTASLLEIAERHDFTLEGKSVGIIGVGHVGSLVDNKARALGMTTLLNDPPRQRAEKDFNGCSLDEALAADIVTFHVPLTKDGLDPTFHLLNEETLQKINNNAVLVQASRGGVHDTSALKKAIKEKNLLCAIDVWENEPDIDVELLELAEITSPHIAGYSWTSKVEATRIIYDSACEFFNIKQTWIPPKLPVDFSAPEVDFLSNVTPSTPQPKNSEGIKGISPPFLQGDTGGFKKLSGMKFAVNCVYNIIEDDKKMRKIVDESSGNRGKYFDGMRKKYPTRVEFHQAKVSNPPEAIRQQLSSLGFKIY